MARFDWLVRAAMVAAFSLYAALALVAHWWLSAAAGLLVAGLMAMRHSRARFAAYVFLSLLMLRAAVGGQWAAALFAAATLALLQAPPATRLWPRVGAPARMTRP